LNLLQAARVAIGRRHTDWTITGGNTTPVVRMCRGTGITFTILGNAGAFPITRNQRDDQLVYNLSTSRWNHHVLKLGTDIRRSDLSDHAENFNRGFWSFSSTCTATPNVNYGTAIAAFWAGCINNFQNSFGPASTDNR